MSQAYNLVFSDGTGQRGVPDVNGKPGAGATNIYKMYLAANQVQAQTCFYDPGLGSDPQLTLDWITWGKNLVAKATGAGITRNIRETYEFLIMNDAPDRRIGLFGFSRGAYTVRSLGGLLGLCGIPAAMQGGTNIRGTAKAEVARRNALIDKAIGIYQDYGEEKKHIRKANGAAFRAAYQCREVVPHVIGVFDTVQALGLPGITDVVNFFKHAFHDAELNPKVPFGFQALSIDEDRAIFSPQVWDQRKVAPTQSVEQVWFPGAHSDIGGGYDDRRLSDVTLDWMVAKCAQAGVGLRFPLDITPAPSILGQHHTERTGWGMLWRKAHRGVKIGKFAVDLDPLATRIEDRFDAGPLGYRPEALLGHPRVKSYY